MIVYGCADIFFYIKTSLCTYLSFFVLSKGSADLFFAKRCASVVVTSNNARYVIEDKGIRFFFLHFRDEYIGIKCVFSPLDLSWWHLRLTVFEGYFRKFHSCYNFGTPRCERSNKYCKEIFWFSKL